jgi:tRNA-modifying protein YgfZ
MTVAKRAVDLATARAEAVVYLVERVKIALTGEDRVRWLNGVLTNDVSKLEKGAAQYACALTEKGKVIADVIVTNNDTLGVWAPNAVAPTLVTHWERYIIMDDVEPAIDAERKLLAVQGARAKDVLADAGLRGSDFDDLGVGAGVILEVARSDAEEVLHRLMKVGAHAIENGDVHTLRVEAARATFGFDFDEKSLVQEAGLEARAVNFNKGCYHGQEVVCMLENRGHVNKRLVQLKIDPGGQVQVGAEVSVESPIGKITSVVPKDDGSAIALALIKVAHAKEGATVRVGDRPARVSALAT